ncbi:hypothetical protein CLH62_15705 [Marinobacter guineae]|uniref:DUF748 domain-containing protein n=1 Tax=Marinobacter guineae TaxID=432303 RepID=A0A2G1VC41_9GAMM|nr:DUF748 domain-containing protein [Marinobacter guineae]PHQ24353.1 hypothetical protein CLH62_15705 [Marinobacter guineae]
MSRRFLSRLWGCLRHVHLWVLVAVALYTLAGFFLVPWLAGWIAEDKVREDLGRELRIGDIDFNPYTFTLQVTDFALADPDGHELVAFDRLFVNFTLVSLIDQAWTFQQIRLEGPAIQEERFASGETRFARLKDDASGEPEATGEGGMPAMVIRHLDVVGGTIRFANHLTTASDPSGTTATIAVQEFALSLDDAALHENTGFPVQFAGQLKAGGAFSFDGEMRVSPAFEINGGLRLEALALSPAEPYLQQLARLAIKGGNLRLDGRLSVSDDEHLAYRGSAGVDGLSLAPLDPGDTEPVVGWQAMEIEQLDLSLAQRSIEASSVSIEGGSGRVIIHEDRTTNFNRLLVARAEGDDPALEGDDGEDAAPLRVSIAGIVMADSRLQFADQSLPLPFSTRIQKLNGEVSTLASDTQTPADVQLEGQVGEYGMARIEGTIHAWQPTRDTNVTLTFRNLMVPDYSPYTVAFAGRRIAEGRMDLDLGYRLADGKLEGSNAIVLHDLELGEKVEIPGAMDLPLSLAVALLKDSEGVIRMDIPVTGDLGDPNFELGGAVRSAIGDAIGTIVSAPFRFLAGLLGAGEEDLQRIAYPAGRSDLTPPQRQRVGLLRKALVKRPELALELAGPFDPDVDGPALKRQHAVEQLAEWLREQGREVSSPDLTAEPTQDAMEAIFSSAYPETSLDEVRERFTREPDENPEGRSAFDAVAYRAHLAEEVIAAQPVTDADLVALGQARAAAVRDRLLADASDGPEKGTAVEPERVLLAEPREVESENDEQVVMEVGLSLD